MGASLVDTSGASIGTGTLNGTTTTVGATPIKGVLAVVVTNGAAAQIDTVTYGSATIPEVAGSPNLHTSGEVGSVSVFFLGTSLPQGDQSWSVTVTGASEKFTRIMPYTGAADLAIEDLDFSINSDAVANPSGTLNTGVGIDCALVLVFHSGIDLPGSITPLAGWTTQGEGDFGTQTCGVYTKDANTTGGDQTYGWTQGSNDAVAIGVAIKESSGGKVTRNTRSFPLGVALGMQLGLSG